MELIKSIFASRSILLLSSVIAVIYSIVFIYLYFHKNGRDERGRGIFATSCFIAMCVYLVIINLIAGFSDEVFGNILIVKSIFVHTYNAVLLVHFVSTLILRKIR